MKYAVHLFKPSELDKFLSLAQPKLQDPRFPSWAPDWTVKNKRSNLAEAFIPQGKRLFKTATSSPFMMQLDDNGRMLVSRVPFSIQSPLLVTTSGPNRSTTTIKPMYY